MKSPASTDISSSRPEDGRFADLLESTPGAEKHRDLCLKFWDGGVGASDDWMAWAHAACTSAGIPQGRIGSRLAALVDWVDGAKKTDAIADPVESGPALSTAPVDAYSQVVESLRECELFIRVLGLDSKPAAEVAQKARAALAVPHVTTWRCFHCDELFTDRDAAQLHFGSSDGGVPACRLAPDQAGLIAIIREQGDELSRFREEETASFREFYSLGAEHAVALRREEEKGYSRGLADGRSMFDVDVRDVEPFSAAPSEASFQDEVSEWIKTCFPADVCDDMRERGDRVLEEVLELLQSHGYDRRRVAPLVQYVYERPVGEPKQEMGGVMVTLAAYARAARLGMYACANEELSRIRSVEVIAKIRKKQELKRAIHSEVGAGEGGLPVFDHGALRHEFEALCSLVENTSDIPPTKWALQVLARSKCVRETLERSGQRGRMAWNVICEAVDVAKRAGPDREPRLREALQKGGWL